MLSRHRLAVISVSVICSLVTITTVLHLYSSSLLHRDVAAAVDSPSSSSELTQTELATGVTELAAVNPTPAEPSPVLVWTSLQNGQDKETTFFSAHYEMRKNSPLRGAVTVLGYHMKALKDLKLYYVLTYPNKSSMCITVPLQQQTLVLANLDGDKIATSHMYVCGLRCRRSECSEDEIPVSVAISRNTDCTDASAQIPVINRQLPKESEKKTLGTCVQGPVYGSTSLEEIVEFIEMNRALGVDIITLYVMEMENETWQFLEDHYVNRGYLRLLRWKKMEKWIPLHYFGQPLLLQDCLYRNMHKVKYLAIHDLDEILLPKTHKTLPQLLNSIEGHDSYHSYSFGNCFYIENESEDKLSIVPCDKMHVPKYFTKTNRLKCYCFDHSPYRNKYIVQTDLAVELCTHELCRYIRGRSYDIPHSLANNAHYRNALPNDCNDKTTTHDTAAFQHQAAVIESIGEQLCMSPSIDLRRKL